MKTIKNILMTILVIAQLVAIGVALYANLPLFGITQNSLDMFVIALLIPYSLGILAVGFIISLIFSIYAGIKRYRILKVIESILTVVFLALALTLILKLKLMGG